MSTFLEVFFSFVAGGITLWGLLQVEKHLKRRRREPAGERTAHESLKAMSTQLQQAAARLSKPTVGPPPTQLAPPPAAREPTPWPHGDFFGHVADEAPNDPKAY